MIWQWMTTMNDPKVDVGDIMIPLDITWEDGKVFAIDCVTDSQQAAAIKAGGQGDQYTLWVHSQQSYLFFERSAV